MQDWLRNASEICASIETTALTTEIHKCRSKTLASRVMIVLKTIKTQDQKKFNLDVMATKASFSMLLATFGDIRDYFKILQKIDNALGKRVKRFGSDEESFSKWNETLLTCSADLKLGLVSDLEQDLSDFNADMQDLQANLKTILEKVIDLYGSVELAVAANKKLLEQQ